jgi:hypothetical protein
MEDSELWRVENIRCLNKDCRHLRINPFNRDLRNSKTGDTLLESHPKLFKNLLNYSKKLKAVKISKEEV